MPEMELTSSLSWQNLIFFFFFFFFLNPQPAFVTSAVVKKDEQSSRDKLKLAATSNKNT